MIYRGIRESPNTKLKIDMSNKFYITTPIFYPNAKPHMGHAYTTVMADILARYRRLKGDDVYFLTGVDENSEKIVRVAKSLGQDVGTYLDEAVSNFKNLYTEEKLNISFDQFIRTSDEKVHWPGAEELWKRLEKAQDIELRSYEGLYCVGHEAFITEKDLVDGKCPDHNEVPQTLKEENYFFKLSKYTKPIKEKIESGELTIVPESRRNEILALLERGLEDVSFSRPASKVSVGIPVPGNPSQKMYVWCDALSNYISALGFGTSHDDLYKKYWDSESAQNLHVIGKDILRFHTAIWPGMLLSAGLPLPKKILVHGFITSDGKKMSKSLGNVIDPDLLIKEYGGEAVRYYLARHISPFEDGDITLDKFKEVYNANLANGLGNLVSRVMKMAETYLDQPVKIPENTIPESFFESLEHFDVQKSADVIWYKITELDETIQRTAPFKLVKVEKEKALKIIEDLVLDVYTIARMLNPIMPLTMEKIKKAVKENKMPSEPLFARKN